MDSKVLIIDDSLTVRMDLQEAFTAAGFAMALSATLAAAREELARSPFDLIVLDVLLPDGDGVDFLAELRADAALTRVPVMLLSTEAEVRDRVRGLNTGADDYVGKPYERSYVVARAVELIGKHAGPKAARSVPLVLVIDDSPTFAEELRATFEAGGYAVQLAGTGEEGLRLAVQVRPDAVVVDGQLPGIDGATVVRRLRSDSALRRTPCLLLTASEEREDELQSLEAGADTFVRKGEGTDVVLARLTASLRQAAQPLPGDGAASLLGPKRILAVDDSITYLQELASRLRQDEYDVVLARSGEEALDLLNVQPVDCILLDLVMPGLSGDEACRRIKANSRWRDIPLVMLTAREDRDTMIAGFNAGADDFISKSSAFDVLHARLRAQLRRKQFEDETRRMREELLSKELEAAEARANRELAETRARLLQDLEQANKELEAFSYSVSHDLRAPLRAIGGFSQILVEKYGEQLLPEARHYLDRVHGKVQEMDRLISDLLAFSRLSRQALQKQTVALNPLVQEVLQSLQGEIQGRSVEIVVAPLPPCQGDAALLRQVFVNLLSNALKYSRKQVQARVEVGSRFDPAYGGTVYYVRDNGVGFDMRYAHKLFGVFQRLHRKEDYDGTGVGLAIVQRIIVRHGGRIWAAAEVDRGATFSFALN
ncbi:MAG: response regulator [Planctomycetia bacterium]|nr:response regulator [Planctomycetia bacterium]